LGHDARSTKARLVRWLAVSIVACSCSSPSGILPGPVDAGDGSDGPEAAADSAALDGVNVNCPTRPGSGGRVCSGSYTISHPGDLVPLADCQHITGNLIVQADGWMVNADVVERIDGDVTVEGAVSAHFAKLVHIQGEFSVSGVATLTAPRLVSTGGALFSVFAGSASFDCLASASHLYVAGDDVRFPSLRTVDTIELATKGQADFSALESAPQILLSGVSDVTFPSLRNAMAVRGITGGRLSMPVIEQLASIDITGFDHVDINVVRLDPRSDSLSLRDVGEAIFPRLTHAGRSIIGSVRDRLTLPVLRALESLAVNPPEAPSVNGATIEMPVLETAGFLMFQSSETNPLRLQEVIAPKLQTVGTLRFVNTSLLTAIAFPALENAANASFVGNADLRVIRLPALTTMKTPPVAGFLDIGGLSCPAPPNCLPSPNPELLEFDLSALRFATVRIRWNPMLPQCRVEALATQLQQAGLGGTVFSMDNRPTCPP
jgi:hypothetical protein